MIPALRIGTGFDVHRLVKGRDLVLGGVKIPFELGLLGHSDADCLSHAICDALLGAAGLGGFMEEMSANITSALSISKGHLNLKATTTEGLGFEGRGEGIGATAVALIYKRDEPIV